MKSAKRLAAVVLLGVAIAALLPSVHADAAKPVCIIPPCPTDTPNGNDNHGNNTPDPVTPTPTATVEAAVIELATPVPTPSLPDTGFAESNQVSQGQNAAAPQLVHGPPPAIANYAAAPGFGSIGVPLMLLFAVAGAAAYALRRRI